MCSVLRYFFPLLYQYSCQSYMYRSTSILTLLLLSSSIYSGQCLTTNTTGKQNFGKIVDRVLILFRLIHGFLDYLWENFWRNRLLNLISAYIFLILTICGKILEGIGFWISSQYIYIFQICGNLNMGDSNHQIIYWDPRLTLRYHVQS